tara:strand:- start:829 stop:1032 length:204 start_codon:yes stop_codon:yes gene_type:complete
MATTIKVLRGSGFVETQVNSTNVGDLRAEQDIPASASVSVNGEDAVNSTEFGDGSLIAWVNNNKTGG